MPHNICKKKSSITGIDTDKFREPEKWTAYELRSKNIPIEFTPDEALKEVGMYKGIPEKVSEMAKVFTG